MVQKIKNSMDMFLRPRWFSLENFIDYLVRKWRLAKHGQIWLKHSFYMALKMRHFMSRSLRSRWPISENLRIFTKPGSKGRPYIHGPGMVQIIGHYMDISLRPLWLSLKFFSSDQNSSTFSLVELRNYWFSGWWLCGWSSFNLMISSS